MENKSSVNYILGHDKRFLKGFAINSVENSAAYLLPYLQPSMRVLDVGCAEGSMTVSLAQHCASGSVVGVDIKPEVVESASKLHESVPNLSFQVGDIFKLPFADCEFDVVHAHQVLEFVAGANDALAELKRVTKSGGLVAVSCGCGSQLLACPGHEEITSLIRATMAGMELAGANPKLGATLPLLAMKAGFESVKSSSSVMFYSSEEERGSIAAMGEAILANPALVAVMKSHGIDDEDKIKVIKDKLEGLRTSDHGFFMLPHIEVLCRK